TYVISDTVLIGSNTVLQGDPEAVIKLKDKASWQIEKPLITQLNSSGNSNITIKGLEIDGNHEANRDKSRGKGYYNLIQFLNSENIKIHDLYMHDSHGDGLKITKCSNIQFYNNTVYKLGHDALYAIYSSDVKAWNNKITCRTNSGLRIYNTNHVKFQNNIIDSKGEGGAGIEVQKTGPKTVMNDIEISNNLLYQTNAAGIWITGYGSKYSTDSAKDIHIHHNKFYETGIDPGSSWAGGIVVNGFQNTLIEDNLFDGCYGAAVAHKQVDSEFLAPDSGYQTIVRNNMIINTQSSPAAGEGYAINNELRTTHSFLLKNNCLSNNAGGNYLYASSLSDVEADPEFLDDVNENESLRKDFPWIEAISAGPERPYEIEDRGFQADKEGFISRLKDAFSSLMESVKEFLSSLYVSSAEEEKYKTFLPPVVSDNRLRTESSNTTFRESEYIDIGEREDGGIYRGLILFKLNEFNKTDQIKKANFSLFWYYPEEIRAKNTILEVYRPVKWCEEHVTWNEKEAGIPWNNSGGDWYDKNGVLGGSTPYATITINNYQLPDNRYYEFNVTELVQEYVNGKYENTGFLIKARQEDENYIAFYSSDWKEKDRQPKLIIEYM
ncbi:MAG: disaggregatase related repeat-containing protein, partial [Methanosarcina sp.]